MSDEDPTPTGGPRADVDPGRLRAEMDAYAARIESLTETIESLEETVAERDQRITDLEEELAELRERTDLLAHIAEPTALEKEQRIAVYLQTLHARVTRDDGRASLTVSEADSAVGGDIDRTTIYVDFNGAEKLVDSDGVALAAIRALSEKVDEKDERIEDLETENERKEARIDELEERLAALEAQVGSTGVATADD